MQVQLILSSLLVPLLLSFMAQRLHGRYLLPAVFTVWLICYLWIAGIPALPPAEAIEWIVLMSMLFVALSFYYRQPSKTISILRVAFFVSGLGLIAWPIIRHAPDITLVAELLLLSIVAGYIILRLSQTTPATPALTLAITNTGLALVSSLGASLLIGQLSAVIAATLGAFSLHELKTKLRHSQLDTGTLSLLTLMTLWLLASAILYANISLISASLIAFSLLLGLIIQWRYASVISLLAVGSSLLWLFATTDSSSYY